MLMTLISLFRLSRRQASLVLSGSSEPESVLSHKC